MLLEAEETRGLLYSFDLKFGLDHDLPEMFDATYAFLEKIRAPLAFVSIGSSREGPLDKELRVSTPCRPVFVRPHVHVPSEEHDGRRGRGGHRPAPEEVVPFQIHRKALRFHSFAFRRDSIPSNLFFNCVSRKGVDTVEYY